MKISLYIISLLCTLLISIKVEAQLVQNPYAHQSRLRSPDNEITIAKTTTFRDGVNTTEQYFNTFGGNTKDVYYKLTLTTKADLTIWADDLGITTDYVLVYLLDRVGDVISLTESHSSPLHKKALSPDTYYLVLERNIHDGEIYFNIESNVPKTTPINIGSKSSYFTYANTQNSSNSALFANGYGGMSYNDIPYTFTITKPMDIKISHCGSSLSYTNIFFTDGTFSEYMYCEGTKQRVFLKKDLPAGTYTFISEGETQNGNITTTITGTVSKTIDIGKINFPLSYQDTRNSNDWDNNYTDYAGKEVGYRINHWQSSDLYLQISNCGSNITDTRIQILDGNNKVVNSSIDYNNVNSPCKGTKHAFLRTGKLNVGTYFIVSEGRYVNGNITTKILASKYPFETDWGVLRGMKNKTGTYNIGDCHNLYETGSGNDIIHKFTLEDPLDVIISHAGSTVNKSKIYLLNASMSVITFSESGAGDPNGNNVNHAFLKRELLPAGTYYIVSEATSQNANIVVGLTTSPKPKTPIDIGSKSTEFTFTDTKRYQDYTNTYDGNKLKNADIEYKLSVTQVMNLTTSINSSGILYLLDAHRGLIKQSFRTLNVNTLQSGTYYIINENYTTNEGNTTISISGTLVTASNSINPSMDKSHIQKRIYTEERERKYLTEIQYYDGLGRPDQLVQSMITPNGGDLVAIQEYDEFGRQSNSWLPTPIHKNKSKYMDVMQVRGHARNIYQDANPHNKPVYENSPLNRVMEQYGSGQNWHNNSKAVRYEYGTNKGAVATSSKVELATKDTLSGTIAACDQIILKPGFAFKAASEKSLILYIDPSQCNQPKTLSSQATTSKLSSLKAAFLTCTNYGVSNNTLVRKGNYSGNELLVTLVTDEDDNISLEFKDKIGQVILTRQINGSEKYDTYYVYDDFGNLFYVLPPLAIDKLTQDISDNSQVMKQYAYVYKYDGHNRCIKKRLPGCDWIYYVYDKADRLIFTQDGEQRKTKEWTFNKYDALGRAVIIGLFITDKTHDQLQTLTKNTTVVEKYFLDIHWSYTWDSLSDLITPTNYKQILQVNYYDNYEFRKRPEYKDSKFTFFNQGSEYNTRYGTDESVFEHKGQLTGIATALLDGQNKFIYTVMYYDNKGRTIQTRSTNHLEGMDYVYTSYDFIGNPTKMYTEQTVKNDNNQTITTKELYTYTYDHAGRPTKTTHQLNGGTTVTLAENTYDELGRLKTNKKANNANLNTTYTYNVRSWTTNISEQHFKESLTYNYNGNIKAMSWTQEGKTRKYDYTYDNLSRLKNANYAGATDERYSTTYTHDKMGNIQTLVRYGKKDAGNAPSSYNIIDNLTMKYTGNQLINVHDTGIDVPMKTSYDFKDYSKDAPQTKTEYTYNQNGAMNKDLNRGITNIQYNSLNLPLAIEIASPHAKGRIKYLYTATGVKLRTIHETDPLTLSTPIAATTTYSTGKTEIKTTDYVNNKIYEDQTLKRILIGGGYIENNTYHFYSQDHLGNNRITMTSVGTITQQNHYYPFGMTFADNTTNDTQPYKYNGKEFDNKLGVNQYDYSTRYYEPSTGRLTTIDPHAESYYGWSPYVYVGNNPINRIDPTGMDTIHVTNYQDKSIPNGPTSYQEVTQARRSGGEGDIIIVDNDLSEIIITPNGAPTKVVGGITLDNNGRVIGETPLENVDFEVYSTLSGVGGIARGAVGKSAVSYFSKKGYNSSLKYLRSQGLTKSQSKEILKNFEKETISLRIANNSTFGLRFYGGEATAKGRYLFPTFTNYTNRRGLALLPKWNNTMSNIKQFQIAPGTPYVHGRAATQGGIYSGGNYQMYIHNINNLIK